MLRIFIVQVVNTGEIVGVFHDKEDAEKLTGTRRSYTVTEFEVQDKAARTP